MFELLYRGTRDGFASTQFHKLCDNKGPTVTLAKSNFGQVFGGYASVSWQSFGGVMNDQEAFLFSVSKVTKHG